MFDFFKNLFISGYKTHSEAVIVSCFYNPMNSPYRLLAFQKWYHSIKHLNHRIVELLIGPDAKPQLPNSPYISRLRSDSLLWHKESLLNKVISELPEEYKYVFWIDADVLFTNKNWLVESVEKLQTANIIQPFEYCVHLDKNQLKPSFDVEAYRSSVLNPMLGGNTRHPQLWRSFCANYVSGLSGNTNYDIHGHVGFAWGARREVLDAVPLYDKALIGGADHIMAHAAAGHIPHPCISKSFTDDLDDVLKYSQKFYSQIQGRISYTNGDLYHIWHGDISHRQYLKRIKDFTKEAAKIGKRDKNGLYIKTDNNDYMKRYYKHREVVAIIEEGFDGFDAGFFEDMGYAIYDIIDVYQSQQSQQRPQVFSDPDLPSAGAIVEDRSNYEQTPESVPAWGNQEFDRSTPDHSSLMEGKHNYEQRAESVPTWNEPNTAPDHSSLMEGKSSYEQTLESAPSWEPSNLEAIAESITDTDSGNFS